MGASISVADVTWDMFRITTGYTQSFILSGNSDGTFQWVPNSTFSVSGTENQIAKFTGTNSVGNSIMFESAASKIYIGYTSSPTNTNSCISLGVTASMLVNDRIFLTDNICRSIGFTNSDTLELNTTQDFRLILNTASGRAPYINACANLTTNDRSLQLLSGLVSVNDQTGSQSLNTLGSNKNPTFSARIEPSAPLSDETKATTRILMTSTLSSATQFRVWSSFPNGSNTGLVTRSPVPGSDIPITATYTYTTEASIGQQVAQLAELITASGFFFATYSQPNVLIVTALTGSGYDINQHHLLFPSQTGQWSNSRFNGGSSRRVALGISQGHIQIQDGSQATGKVLISSTNDGLVS